MRITRKSLPLRLLTSGRSPLIVTSTASRVSCLMPFSWRARAAAMSPSCPTLPLEEALDSELACLNTWLLAPVLDMVLSTRWEAGRASNWCP